MRRLSIMSIEYIIFSSLVWCTFNESFSAMNVLTGVVLGISFFKISARFLEDEDAAESNNKNFSLSLYILRLMVDIYINTFSLICLLFTKKLDPTLVKVRLKGRGKISSLIANSITLTPKTATIDKEGDLLTVLCAHDMTRGEIVDTFEIRTLKEEALNPSKEFIQGVKGGNR